MTTPASAANDRTLAGCPFCGGKARIESNRDWHKLKGDHSDDCFFESGEEMAVLPATDECLAQMVAYWDRRAIPQPAAEPSPLEAPQVWSKQADMVVSWERGSAKPEAEPVLVESLRAALRSVNAVAIERGDKFGACDQIDNDGQPYQSAWFADLLSATPDRAPSAGSTPEPWECRMAASIQPHPIDYFMRAEIDDWRARGAGSATFDRRWSLACDGFGLQRNDKSGEYVTYDDAVAVIHAAIAAMPKEPT